MRLLSILFLVAASLVLAPACNPPAPKKPGPAAKRLDKKKRDKKKRKKKKRAPKPTDPWLAGVIEKAKVRVERDGKTTECRWDAGRKRHVCDGEEEWVYVAGHVGNTPKENIFCAWNHPAAGGVVKTTLAGVAKEKLEFRHTIPGRAATLKHLDPIDVVLKVDGKEVAKLQRTRTPGLDGKVIEPVKSGAGDLEIAVSAKTIGAAHYCWQLRRVKGDGAKTAVAPVPTPGDPPKKKVDVANITPDAKKKAVSRAAKTTEVKRKLKVDRKMPVKGAEAATVKDKTE